MGQEGESKAWNAQTRRTEASLQGLVTWKPPVPWVSAVLCTQGFGEDDGEGGSESSSSREKFGHDLKEQGEATS